ncbi:protealysin inhibitor emfourin [Allocoleopsis sp.]|uniref:protealysin inhibitor emfourin n=1 Tax=Allocoleopsis sp. TaxID=3088169 RepID=UPI002FD3927B
MRMTFERTGGFAGMTITKVVDTTTLPAEDSNQLRRLVDAADFFHLPATIITKSRQPDRFQYHLTIQEDNQQHTVVVSEQAVPSSLRLLIEWLMAAARHS